MNARPPPVNLSAVKTVQCSCGYVASGETAEELLADVEAHIAAEHGRLHPSEEEPMKHFKRSATTRLLAAVAAAAAALAVTGPTDAAAPVACAGTVNLTGLSNVEVRVAGPETFLSLDFTGTHDICLADGSLVTGTVAGHLVQRLAPDGDLTLRFDEVLSYGGGTLGYRGEASLSGSNWQGHVQTVGAGTGALAGISGQGSFFPTGPTSFADVIDYVYR